MRLLENDQDEGAGALVRAGGAQVLVIRQIAWMTVCVPGLHLIGGLS